MRVTRKAIKEKAKNLYEELNDGEDRKQFNAIQGWSARFFKRHGISLRRKTTQSQKTPADIIPKMTRFVLYVRKCLKAKKFDQVLAYDETAVWLDATSDTTYTRTGESEVSMKTTGHEKMNITVGLMVAFSGVKNKPFVVFKGKGKTVEAKELAKIRDVFVTWSDNGWFNDDLTSELIEKNFGFHFGNTLLIWD